MIVEDACGVNCKLMQIFCLRSRTPVTFVAGRSDLEGTENAYPLTLNPVRFPGIQAAIWNEATRWPNCNGQMKIPYLVDNSVWVAKICTGTLMARITHIDGTGNWGQFIGFIGARISDCTLEVGLGMGVGCWWGVYGGGGVYGRCAKFVNPCQHELYAMIYMGACMLHNSAHLPWFFLEDPTILFNI